MNSEFEALGKYTFYRELAEAHLTCVKVCGEVMQEMLDRAKTGAFSVDPASAQRLFDKARQAREQYLRFAALANASAKVCGREPLSMQTAEVAA